LVPQQNALESATDDPALVIVGQIDVLWGADEAINLRGNGEQTNAEIIRDHVTQLAEWRDAQVTVSFTMAPSLTDALIQMVIAAEHLDTKLSNIGYAIGRAASRKSIDFSDIGIENGAKGSAPLLVRYQRDLANVANQGWDDAISVCGYPSDNWLQNIYRWADQGAAERAAREAAA
jgi:hypothetical protein